MESKYFKVKNPETGGWIDMYGPTYKKLIESGKYTETQLSKQQKLRSTKPKSPLTLQNYNKNNKFDIESLPADIQNEIFSKDVHLLKTAPHISKMINKSTHQAICQMPINKKEMIDYVNTMEPERIYIFPLSELRSMTKFNVNKCYLRKYKKINEKPTYAIIVEWIHYSYNIVNLNIDKSNDLTFNLENFIRDMDYDLLTSYHIYNKRPSCQIKNYAKTRVIHHLTSKKVNYENINYVNLLVWYMYLRINLYQFPVQLYNNKYSEYRVTTDEKDDIILVEPYIDSDVLMIDLKNDCMMMYQELLKQLNLLD